MHRQATWDQDLVVPATHGLRLGHASRVATALFARAKVECCSEGPSLTRPMSSVFLTDAGQAFQLQGLPFHDHPAPEKDQHTLAVKLVAHCTDAWAVVDIGAGWGADRCAVCAEKLEPYPEPCPGCGAAPSPPNENPFRHGMLLAVLHLRESPFNFAWLAEERGDQDGHAIAWTDVKAGEPYPASPIGRFEVPWAIDSWMDVHVLVNLPVMGQFLGHPPLAELVEKAREVEAGAPAGFEFLRLEPARMTRVIRRVALDALVR